MDKAEYARAATAVYNRYMAKIPGASVRTRHATRSLAELARGIEVELRALEPPTDDAAALEEHFLRLWTERADFLESVAKGSLPRFMGPVSQDRFLLEAGLPQDRQEDVEFCRAYGLDGCRA